MSENPKVVVGVNLAEIFVSLGPTENKTGPTHIKILAYRLMQYKGLGFFMEVKNPRMEDKWVASATILAPYSSDEYALQARNIFFELVADRAKEQAEMYEKLTV